MARAREDRQIPVVLVSGFLGSGKTTLLNHLLRNNRGIRIGVVVNDFGSINIDSMMVAGQVDSMVSLGNGCLCCAVDAAEMDTMFDALASSASNIDVIVVEASGLAEPRNLIRLVLASENRRIVYGGLVGVVDGVEFAGTRRSHPEIDHHLRLADLVVLNKIDRLDSAERAVVRDVVRDIVGEVPILETAHGRVDAQLLFDVPERTVDRTAARQLSFDELLYEEDDHSSHLHAGYSTTTLFSDEPMDPRRFVELLENPSGDVYRSKGFVHFDVDGYRGKYVLNTVGRHIRLNSARWDPGEVEATRIVLIGTDIDAEYAEVRFLDCVRRPGDATDASAMLPVHRYTSQN
ncbi:GTP-binding protein [Rhodococcus sp. BP-252]|uniref:Cobalamin biosynthesis protein n=1 Tax=Rhodococcoides kyotonense TaxID=398843 RepID=A0A177YMK9_9NOCA|nr:MULTISPECIES: GTP-binding protein [Rhodococcus]MBY6412367.1 GTP-binding protein [Rhodococcus sp. BP-320]MBY6416947.1 GTP-binding protein [Rhodococcus sp. BP-321]MBY6422090.1 GTP-binding protein [Rhodococcus sp. BP-324]MBY6426971.1 GTP-binding protein [Rhodococcus sp. BP-323]MBY6432300.1 GTP-binding protein [Rhodococcus sp. BP-322]